MNTENIRESFRPNTIRLLLIGESPPAGGTFFYENSHFTSYTASAFAAAQQRRFSNDNQIHFLEHFKACHCYLDDVCHRKVDKLDREEREWLLARSVPNLASRLKNYQPEAIAIFVKRVEPHVRIAVVLADISPKLYTVPFPGYGHQARYIEAMQPIIKHHAGNIT